MYWMRFKSRWQCPFIFKNGFSTLAYVSYYEHSGKLSNINDSQFDNLYNNNYYYTNYNCTLKTFVVWRDPYERLLSLWKDCYISPNNHSNLYYVFNINRDIIINDIKIFIDIAKQNYNNNKEGHITSQTTIFNIFNNKFDKMVLLKDLPTFIDKELGFPNVPICNKTSNDIDISKFEKYKDEIKEIYKDDYKLLETYKDKIYILE